MGIPPSTVSFGGSLSDKNVVLKVFRSAFLSEELVPRETLGEFAIEQGVDFWE